jgi:hypothetical protein
MQQINNNFTIAPYYQNKNEEFKDAMFSNYLSISISLDSVCNDDDINLKYCHVIGLKEAIVHNNTTAIDKIISAAKANLNIGYVGCTPLLMAVSLSQPEIAYPTVIKLIQNGASVNVASGTDKNGHTHSICNFNSKEFPANTTPLYAAVIRRHIPTIMYLISQNAIANPKLCSMDQDYLRDLKWLSTSGRLFYMGAKQEETFLRQAGTPFEVIDLIVQHCIKLSTFNYKLSKHRMSSKKLNK